MAQVKTYPFVRKLEEALVDGLRHAGIRAEVDHEPVPGTKLRRFIVLASQFKSLPHSERQNLVWRIAENALPFEEQLLVSMILTLTPEEAGTEPARSMFGRTPRRRRTARTVARR